MYTLTGLIESTHNKTRKLLGHPMWRAYNFKITEKGIEYPDYNLVYDWDGNLIQQ